MELPNANVVDPSHGERRVWLDMARKNAVLAIGQRVRDRATQEGRLVALREALGLPGGMQRIECFDISHTGGEGTVASCVVFGPEGLMKKEYRRFNITGVTPGDDYAALKQALERRYTRISDGDIPPPDLLLIDVLPGRWEVRQVFDDPAGDHDWGISAEVDLAASDAEGAAVVRVTGLDRL